MLRSIAVGALAAAALLLSAARQPQATVAQAAITYGAGWNLIAGPAGSHVRGAAGSLYTWRSTDTNYEALPSGSALESCVGYWAYFPVSGSLEPGNSTTACTVPLAIGEWVLAGGPSAQTAGVIAGDAVAYAYTASGYQPISIVPIGRGVWLYGSGTVTVTAGSGPRSAP